MVYVFTLSHQCGFWRIHLEEKAEKPAESLHLICRYYIGERKHPWAWWKISVLLKAWLTVCKKTERWVKMVSIIVQQQSRMFDVGLVLHDTRSCQYCLSEQEKSSTHILGREGIMFYRTDISAWFHVGWWQEQQYLREGISLLEAKPAEKLPKDLGVASCIQAIQRIQGLHSPFLTYTLVRLTYILMVMVSSQMSKKTGGSGERRAAMDPLQSSSI